MAWTRERLFTQVKDLFQDARLIIVANREPYIHRRDEEAIHWIRPASGLVTALDPVGRACGGTWIAHASGDADRETADEEGRLGVPPDRPSYTLRRIWLTKEEEEGYYYGFSNEALWPLCHISYTRPLFEASDWEHYRKVNERFAEAVLQEIEGHRAIVFVQDYHFALLPRLVKDRRPDAVVCQFWHIPWPNREVFRICPWREEILHGLLGNDLLGFHVQFHCNNFLDTVDRMLEAKVDYERFAVTRGGKSTLVRPFPISIDVDLPQLEGKPIDDLEVARARRELRLKDQLLLVGVDRIDYTKGIPERLRAIDRLLDKHPEHRERILFVQLGAPSRTHIKHYRVLNEEIDELVEEINWKHGNGRWRPIQFLRDHHDARRVFSFYKAANVCLVSSLHDGMNLVAKEFIAARNDLRGVLVLSHFTGAAVELEDALLVNPYATDRFADVLHTALTMPPEEQESRMRRMRDHVTEHNIYQWAGQMLTEAARILDAPPAMRLKQDLERLIGKHRAGGRLILLLDYDGTLAPIVSRPELATLPPGTRRLLAALARGPRVQVGVVSSRELDDLRHLVGLEGIAYAGSCGLELEIAGGRRTHPDAPFISARMAAVAALLRDAMAALPGARVEAKRLGATVHYRDTPRDVVPLVLDRAQAALAPLHGEIRVLDGPEALEVWPAGVWTKGSAVRELVEESGRPAPAVLYAGDHTNDADAMETTEALQGVTIGIGPWAPPPARHRLADPRALVGVLARILEAIGRAEGGI